MSAQVTPEAAYWDGWNAEHREQSQAEQSLREAEIVLDWVERLDRTDLRILEVGCGTGWFSARLAQYGQVTALDITPNVLERARERHPEVTFHTGDVMNPDMPLTTTGYDVVVALEVLSHVEDQAAFIARLTSLLAPGGHLMMATQNRPVLENHCNVEPPHPDQRRNWVDRHELAALIRPHLRLAHLTSACPTAHKGPRRLLAAPKLRKALGPSAAGWWSKRLEDRWWGWMLMAHAVKAT